MDTSLISPPGGVKFTRADRGSAGGALHVQPMRLNCSTSSGWIPSQQSASSGFTVLSPAASPVATATAASATLPAQCKPPCIVRSRKSGARHTHRLWKHDNTPSFDASGSTFRYPAFSLASASFSTAATASAAEENDLTSEPPSEPTTPLAMVQPGPGEWWKLR